MDIEEVNRNNELDSEFMQAVHPNSVIVNEDSPNFHALKVLVAIFLRSTRNFKLLKNMNKNKLTYHIVYSRLQHGRLLEFTVVFYIKGPNGQCSLGCDDPLTQDVMELLSLPLVVKITIPE